MFCAHELLETPKIDWDSEGDEFRESLQTFHAWSDDREVEWNGICDYWESGGINKGREDCVSG